MFISSKSTDMKKSSITVLLILFCSLARTQTIVTFYTTKGNFAVEIYDNIVPITGGNFLTLVNQKFYDGIIFHRVINNFMIQGGDPTGTGSGGPGYSIADEFDPSLSNVQKTISMANSGPNTGGSQFFINLVDNTYLDYNKAPLTSAHAVFGMVIANFNVVQDIGLVPTNSQDRPLTDVVMDSIREGYGLAVGTVESIPEKIVTSFFPNPADPTSKLNITSGQSQQCLIQLTDVSGRTLNENQVLLNAGINQLTLSELSAEILPPGFYHLRILGKSSINHLMIVVR